MSQRLLAIVKARYHKPLLLSVLIVVSYVGAVSRGESMLWIVAAVLTSTLIVGLSWPHWLIRQLSVTRNGPERANEGDTISFRVEVRNHGRLPRFMIEVVDRLPFVGTATRTGNSTDHALGVVGYVGGSGRRSFDAPLVCEKRGFYELGPVRLVSSFPLGLAEAIQRKVGSIQTLLIYPEVFPILALPLHGTPSQIHKGAFLLPQIAGTAEFCGLREYRRGDNPRHIHWATTARLNELMVKEFEPLASASLCLALDLADDANIGNGKHATFEYAVKIAASIAHYASVNGMPFRLAGANDIDMTTAAGTGDRHFQIILERLAVIDANSRVPYAQFLEGFARDCEFGETIVVFVSEPTHRTERTLQAIAALRSQGLHVLAIVFDRASFDESQRHSDSGIGAAVAVLFDLGATVYEVRRDDNFVRVFNS